MKPLESLIEVYSSALTGTKIGLFLGAGVTVGSYISNYSKFALETFKAAYYSNDDPLFKKNIPKKIIEHIEEGLDSGSKVKINIEPDEIFLLIKNNFRSDLDNNSESWKREWTTFCAKQLYTNNEKLIKQDYKVASEIYSDNITLKSILTICAVIPSDLPQPWKNKLESSKYFRGIGINPRIGGIMTTNYDRVLEAAFNQKYTRGKGIRYGMRPLVLGSRKISNPEIMQVAHIHGYLTNVPKENNAKNSGNKKKLMDFVISETDYFKTYYESMSFSNYSAMSFLDNHHTIFIGCSMKDKNIRRYLYHLKNSSNCNTEKIAILRCSCKSKHTDADYGKFRYSCLSSYDIFTNEILKSYGVKVVWLCNHNQIHDLFKEVYKSTGGNWKTVYDYKRV